MYICMYGYMYTQQKPIGFARANSLIQGPVQHLLPFLLCDLIYTHRAQDVQSTLHQ